MTLRIHVKETGVQTELIYSSVDKYNVKMAAAQLGRQQSTTAHKQNMTMVGFTVWCNKSQIFKCSNV